MDIVTEIHENNQKSDEKLKQLIADHPKGF